MSEKLRELEERLDLLSAENLNIMDRADLDSQRDLSEDELSRMADNDAEIERIQAEINRRVKSLDNAQRIEQSRGRRSEPNDLDSGRPQARANGNGNGSGRIEMSYPAHRDPKRGFTHVGDFAMAVKNMASPGGFVDNRLRIQMAAPDNYGSENGDLGVAIPPEFSTAIVKKLDAPESLLSRMRRLNTNSSTVTELVDEDEPWASGGVQVYWEVDGTQKASSRPRLSRVTHHLDKIYALVPMTDTLLEDAPQLEGHLRDIAPERIDFAISLAVLQGDGTGRPLGVLNSPALVSVAKESGQAADTVNFANINNMWSRLHESCRANAVWIIDSDVEPQLNTLAFPTGGGTTAVPAYMPAGGLSGNPYDTLRGRPIIVHEAANQVGDKGDIILMDPSKYTMWTRGGGIRTDVSIHLWFDYDITAFRFTMRVAGQPQWKKPITKRTGGRTQSCFVTLDDRA